VAATTVLADPAPTAPGNSSSANPHGSPPGQGGVIPGNSGSTNPHGTPPGQRIAPLGSGAGTASGGGPANASRSGVGGSAPGTANLGTSDHPLRNWPPAKLPPTWKEIERALGPDNAAFTQRVVDVITQTTWAGNEPGYPQCRVRTRKCDAVVRMDFLAPVCSSYLTRSGVGYRLERNTWVNANPDVELTRTVTATAAVSPVGGAPGVPQVSWGTLPNQVILTFATSTGSTVCVIDWSRKVRVSQQVRGPSGALLRQDQWDDAWSGGVRRPLHQEHQTFDGSNMAYSMTWTWKASTPDLLVNEINATR